MVPTKIDVIAQVNADVVSMKGFIREKFGIVLNDMKIAVNFNDDRSMGNAGQKVIKGRATPFMRLKLGKLVAYPVEGFAEYARLARSSTIGAFPTTDWKIFLRALIAHEMSHVIQFAIDRSHFPITKSGSGRYVEGIGAFESGHGEFFQKIYRIMRKEFINPFVTNIGTYSGRCFPSAPKTPVTRRVPDPVRAATVQEKYLGMSVRIAGKVYEVITYDHSRRKFPLIVRHRETGKSYRITLLQYENMKISA